MAERKQCEWISYVELIFAESLIYDYNLAQCKENVFLRGIQRCGLSNFFHRNKTEYMASLDSKKQFWLLHVLLGVFVGSLKHLDPKIPYDIFRTIFSQILGALRMCVS